MAADAAALTTATPLDGGDLVIDATDGVTIGGAKVVTADLVCDNGVIHVIDSVMLP
ncbi:unannotated protein [freshwater metagenome]|uniref:Unannotated protein n=1 Tax=freshwater metagenome TaxID=449393 RepID=A0A6J7GPR7_9ZZZZ